MNVLSLFFSLSCVHVYVFSVRTMVMKGKAPIDPECTEKIGKAFVFSEGKDVYDIMLNQVS